MVGTHHQLRQQSSRLLKVSLDREQDVVAARQRAREIAALLGFENLDQVRIATAVSELARNAFRYARNGSVEFFIDTEPCQMRVRISDEGVGIANLQEILDGFYHSDTGMGMGIIGTQRLMDSCDIDTSPERGTIISITKLLTKPLPGNFGHVIGQLAAKPPADAFAEVQLQNRELLQTLNNLRARHDELINLTRELEDTNRGVVALYSEIDDQAKQLRHADEMKSRFLSNMSHEFRTPLGSIRALSQLLLDRVDGDLSTEQEKQVRLIRNAANELSEVVNDLLDMAKIEAGKVELNPSEFSILELFSALRGMLKPMVQDDPIELVFDVAPALDTFCADEAKITHILRNFISNALKYTESGSITVGAALENDGTAVRFSVTDTGIGIASEDLPTIFEEFVQIQNPLQKRSKGTGLGLPLCRRLANLLGGYIEVQSALGVGSTFSLIMSPLAQSSAKDCAVENVQNRTEYITEKLAAPIKNNDQPTRDSRVGPVDLNSQTALRG